MFFHYKWASKREGVGEGVECMRECVSESGLEVALIIFAIMFAYHKLQCLKNTPQSQ